MNNIDIIKKHIVKGAEVVLKNDDGTEDKIMLKPLNMAEQALAFKISKKFSGQDPKNIDLSKVDDDSFNLMFDLMKMILKRSVDDLDDELAEQFVLSNIEVFQEVLPKLVPKGKSSNQADVIRKKQEALKK